MSALVAFVHHLAAFTLVAALVLEKVSLRDVAAGPVVKASLFLIVGLVSIIPTLEFLRWGKALKSGQPLSVAPQKIAALQKIVQLEIVGVVAILLCAALMAKGIGIVG